MRYQSVWPDQSSGALSTPLLGRSLLCDSSPALGTGGSRAGGAAGRRGRRRRRRRKRLGVLGGGRLALCRGGDGWRRGSLRRRLRLDLRRQLLDDRRDGRSGGRVGRRRRGGGGGAPTRRGRAGGGGRRRRRRGLGLRRPIGGGGLGKEPRQQRRGGVVPLWRLGREELEGSVKGAADAANLVARVHDVLARLARRRDHGRERVVDVRHLGVEAVEEHREEAEQLVAEVRRVVAAVRRLAHEEPQQHDQRVGGHATGVRVVQAELSQKRLEDEDERRELRRLAQVAEHQVAGEQAGVLRRVRDGDVDRYAARRGDLEHGDAGRQDELLARNPRLPLHQRVQLLERAADRLAPGAARHPEQRHVHVAAREAEAGGARAVQLDRRLRPA
mmetsp:Transcript_17561/g.52956  ORF Transcript_17561/g.52956 Transcript_17561/m.52956 type:complete len:387 (+) Transcript_17561:167-1327(+)